MAEVELQDFTAQNEDAGQWHPHHSLPYPLALILLDEETGSAHRRKPDIHLLYYQKPRVGMS